MLATGDDSTITIGDSGSKGGISTFKLVFLSLPALAGVSCSV